MLIIASAIGGALAGYALALGLALAGLRLAGVSASEGRRAVLAGLILAPAGALAGLIAGGWVAWRWAPAGPATGLSGALATLAALGLSALLGLIWLRSRRPLALNRAPPRLRFELRLPLDAPSPRVTLITDRNTMPADIEAPQPVAEGVLIAGAVDLYFRTRHRQLEVAAPPGAPLRIALPLPAAPPQGDWSPWRVVAPGLALRWRVDA